MKPILISIVLPTYNASAYIDRCVQSLQNQNSKDFEMIFVDDKSEDDSLSIINKYSLLDKRIKVVINSINLGTLKSRINGAMAARGEYIFFVDPDDEIPFDAVRQINEVIKDESPDIISTSVELLPPGRVFRRIIKPSNTASNKNIFNSLFLNKSKPHLGAAGKVYKRHLLLKALSVINKIESKLLYGEDALTLLLVANEAERLSVIKSPLYIYHQNPNSITGAVSLEKINFKIDQLRLVVGFIQELISINNFKKELSQKSATKVITQLKNDMALLAMQLAELLSGRRLYIIRILCLFFYGGNNNALAKLIIFFITFGILRL